MKPEGRNQLEDLGVDEKDKLKTYEGNSISKLQIVI